MFHKNKFHEEARMIVYHLPACFHKLCGHGTLLIFDAYCQVLAKETRWIDDQPCYGEDLELHNATLDVVDLEWMKEVEK